MTEIQSQKIYFSRLRSLGTGERAALRREAGKMLRQADGRAIAAFYHCLPSEADPRQEDRWFAAACLSCLWDADAPEGKPFEQIVAALIRAGALSDSIRHRVELLLDTDWDADGYMLTKLTRLIKLIRQKSDRAAVDFEALLTDLLFWNSERQTVQRKWAKEIYSAAESKNENDEKGEE